MKYFLIILCGTVICFSACKKGQPQNDQHFRDTSVSDLLLNEKFGYGYFSNTDLDQRQNQSKEIYSEFLELYQNGNFEAAILKIEAAIQLVPHGVYYYYYGNCFMEMGDYEYAEKAFLTALKMFDWVFNPWFETGYDHYGEKDTRFTFDHNGAPREGYFTYYNLACLYSLTNRLDLAFDYLKEAIEYSYPYIDHLYNDPDLFNLFNKSKDIKNQIQKIYDFGFVNTFPAKAYYYGRASSSDKWYFFDESNVYNEKDAFVRYGKYEIKNYSIFINYYRVEDTTGVKPIPDGGADYEEYQIINIKDFSDSWEEIPFVSTGPVPAMVWINGGTFAMSSPVDEPGRECDEFQHEVTVSGFFMGKYEVTQKEYQEMMGTNPSSYKGDNLPVEGVNWYDAVEYCNRRSEKEGLTPAYTINKNQIDPHNKSEYDLAKWTVTWNWDSSGYRLPTEAEWEYACRAGTTTPFNTGNIITTDQANCDDISSYYKNPERGILEKTAPAGVGSFSPNAWGLHDMHGNVEEWCWDWYEKDPSRDNLNPDGAVSGSHRVYRGGSFFDQAAFIRSALRGHRDPNKSLSEIGFRLVRG